MRLPPLHPLRAPRLRPYLPAVVVALIVAAAAGLFAGSYTYAVKSPTPHRVPVAAVGEGTGPFLRTLHQRLGAELVVHRYARRPQAVDAVEAQRVFAIVRERGDRVDLDLASAAGASVAELLRSDARAAARALGADLRVRDLKPLEPGDPRGLSLFYITIAAVIVGFLGAVQLAANAPGLRRGERVACTAAYAALGALAIVAAVDWVLDAVRLPLPLSWGILALTMFTSGMVFTMFNALVGRWAILPTWVLMVMLGNPSSGGAVSWPLLPSFLGTIGRWLPPGASVNAQHTAVYFGGDLHPQPYLVLTAWSAACCTLFWTRRPRTAQDPAGHRPAGP
ncbi:ABC transporter permease [Streptomyces sp. DSM 44917]|uniref:ABC transporter permease n=1 Tax=Streptomyces boetiae TaxID=3075541 RepID=A0ABU2LBZ7_9ACTN|nr:ABC transporter permease [Streptomyces sp. DSM 44917]MDT0308996.1 ABC transporter permease [Streptomyces sp. DSM 44917]